jgi:hypothetical protein
MRFDVSEKDGKYRCFVIEEKTGATLYCTRWHETPDAAENDATAWVKKQEQTK